MTCTCTQSTSLSLPAQVSECQTTLPKPHSAQDSSPPSTDQISPSSPSTLYEILFTFGKESKCVGKRSLISHRVFLPFPHPRLPLLQIILVNCHLFQKYSSLSLSFAPLLPSPHKPKSPFPPSPPPYPQKKNFWAGSCFRM